jgi:SNF2 family DNA or RNA helicase
MFNISNEIIAEGCYSGAYQKGLAYYEQGRVKKLVFYEKELYLSATVKGTSNYLVHVYFNAEGKLINQFCDCQAFNNYFGFCKHVVAVLFAIKNNKQIQNNFKAARTRQVAANIFSYFNENTNANQKELFMEPTYIFYYQQGRYSRNYSAVSLNIGEKKTYVVKKIKSFLEAVSTGQQLEFSKKFIYDPDIHVFKPEDREMLDLFQEIYQTYKLSSEVAYNYGGDFSLFKGKEILLPEPVLKRWFQIVRGQAFRAKINNIDYKNVTVLEEDLPINFLLKKKNCHLALHFQFRGNIIPLTIDGEYFFHEGNIYHPSEQQRRSLLPFYQAYLHSPDKSILFADGDQERFVSEILPYVKKAGKLVMDHKLADSIEEIPLKAEIYLDTENEMIIAQLKYIYGDRIINPFVPLEPPAEKPKGILMRDVEKEKKIMSYFEDGEFTVNGQSMHLEGEEMIFDFLYRILPELQKEADIYYSDRFQRIKNRPVPSFQGNVLINQDNNLLELGFELEGIEREELFDVFSALKEKKKYHRLRDGSFIHLSAPELQSMVDLLDGLELKKGDFRKEILEIPKFRALYIDEFVQNNQLKNFKRDKHFKELTRSIREPEDSDFEIPENLLPVLRDYQKTGFKWLKTLAHYGFGGILADDMGLGKTLQAISFIQSERRKNTAPVLVVAPTSVIFNWQAEIMKFARDLKTQVISGNKGERHTRLGDMGEVDVVITSYPLIRRDISLYQDLHFSCCILDEAQYIKNPNSLTARSVKMISAQNLIALTGTPIENSLTELWSIFDFLMPGYLPPYHKFIQKYISAAEKEGGETVIQELSQKVRPFILRRLKKDVVKELPPKIELKMVSELTREQKKIYLAYLESIRGEISGEIEKNGFEKSRIKILAGLTRLRQICCHPSLFLENYKGDSGKLVQLAEVLDDLRNGGHRPLLFSQFTGMLAIIREILDRVKCSYFYLDGSVNTRERLEMVEAFNRGEGEVFLISLKAGGTGINLTGADTVIHFDPWWNPDVEDQATDRAHRIGQDKVVQVMKFISLGTIEEKIYELQQKKKEMIEQVITPGETLLSAMNENEIRELLELDQT